MPGRRARRHRLRRHRWVLTAAVLIVLIVVAAVAGRPVYVTPERDAVSAGDPADAVIALGGVTETAFFAERLVREGVARHAVISNPYGPWVPEMVRLCPAAPAVPAPDTTCFHPSPATTRGEAQELARLAKANGWDDVIVVAPTYHVSRARFITERCYHGRLRLVDPGISYRPWTWAYQYAYQTVGFIKASLQRGC